MDRSNLTDYPTSKGEYGINTEQTDIDNKTRISLIQANIAVVAGVLTAINLDISHSGPALITGMLSITTVTVVEMLRIVPHGSSEYSSGDKKRNISTSTVALNTIGFLFVGGSFFIGAYPSNVYLYIVDMNTALIYFVLIGLTYFISIEVNATTERHWTDAYSPIYDRISNGSPKSLVVWVVGVLVYIAKLLIYHPLISLRYPQKRSPPNTKPSNTIDIETVLQPIILVNFYLIVSVVIYFS